MRNLLYMWLAVFALATSGLSLPAQGRPPSKVRFVVLGDSQFSNPGMYERLMHEMNLLRPDFVIQVGDMIQGYTHDKHQLRGEWRRFRKQISALEVPFFPVPGNHDVVTKESEEVYQELWGRERLVYSFTDGPAHCIILDSWHGEEDDRIAEWQREWLRKDLESFAERNGGKGSEEFSRKSIFVFLHSPLWRYTDDHPGKQDWNKVRGILKEYPVHLVAAGHTHEYVWEEHDGIQYAVINSTAGRQALERGGFFHSYLHITAEPTGDSHVAVMKPASILPLDTVNSEDRDTIPRFQLSDRAIRIDEWQTGRPLDITIMAPILNELDQPRLYRLAWYLPYQSNVSVAPHSAWVEVPPGEMIEKNFRITSHSAPPREKMPYLEIETEETLRTGVVSREWEKRYRAEQEGEIAVEYPSQIELDKPVTFSARYTLFVPPSVEVPKRKGEITIDGKLGEKTWEHAGSIDAFKLRNGDPAKLETQVWLLYDEEFLYVAARLEEPNPDGLRTKAHGDIPMTWNDDDFELFFDPGQTQKDYIRLFQNAAGTRFNSLPRTVPNKYYQSDYRSEIEIGEDSWALEMAIPWSDLALEEGPEPGDVWGLNIGRHRQQNEIPQMLWAGNLYDAKRYGNLKFQ